MNQSIPDPPKPPGLLPKNVQSWLLVSLAFLMVAIMWLTGAKKPQPASKSTAQLRPAEPAEVSESRVAELQRRIEELQRTQMIAETALAEQNIPSSAVEPHQGAKQANRSGPREGPEDPIGAEQKRRHYLSLFASNVALTFRKTDAPQLDGRPGPAELTPPPTSLPALPSRAPTNDSAATIAAQKPSAEADAGKNKPVGSLPAAIERASEDAAGKSYLVREGTSLESVLMNRLDGQFAGPVECLVTTDVYSHNRQHVLIPSGTKLLGETRRVDSSGQTRLAVIFHRLIMPDGYSVSLDQFKGLDQIGDTGLRDQVNNHYLRLFGVSLAIGALGAVAEAGSGGALAANASDLMRQGFAQSTAQSSAEILDRFLNILPTVTIREGQRVKVYLSGDLTLPDYRNHKLASDL